MLSYQKLLKQAVASRSMDQTIPMASPKRMLAYQFERAMATQDVTRVEMAKRMGTSRAALNRLLDSNNPSVTLQTIMDAASALNLDVIVQLQPKEQGSE